MNTAYNNPIMNIEQVQEFFRFLYLEKHLVLHPDTDFSDYTNESGEDTFNTAEIEELNACMDKCFAVCDTYNKDIYELAMDVQTQIINEQNESANRMRRKPNSLQSV